MGGSEQHAPYGLHYRRRPDVSPPCCNAKLLLEYRSSVAGSQWLLYGVLDTATLLLLSTEYSVPIADDCGKTHLLLVHTRSNSDCSVRRRRMDPGVGYNGLELLLSFARR